jgi:hypothetical protein|tara:strand:+ start:159 stop:344 length:186 start_codon:yes stop_codon:yes gene_type:complete
MKNHPLPMPITKKVSSAVKMAHAKSVAKEKHGAVDMAVDSVAKNIYAGKNAKITSYLGPKK